MFDLRWIRENQDDFDAGLARRGLDSMAAEIVALDGRRRAAQTELQEAQTRRNDASKEGLQIDLSLSESNTSKLVAKGGFYRHTNGRWVYRLTEDGSGAERIAIVAGRQNPQSFEILEGLETGDWIISSSYDVFNDVDKLTFSEPINR